MRRFSTSVKRIISIITLIAIIGSLITTMSVSAADVSNATALGNAILAGGEYTLTSDITVANAGINNQSATTGTINGGGHTIKKENSKWTDAVLYQNNASNWKFTDMIIDGSKENGTFSDAALWYMAGSIEFENVIIQNFKCSKETRYAMNNNGASMVLDNVVFTGNENANAAVTQNPGLYMDGGVTRLEGNTSVNIYYAGGTIDASGLGKDCNITIKASDSTTYNVLSGISTSVAAKKTLDDANKTVTITGSGINWSLDAERTLPENGVVTVVANVSGYEDADKNVTVFAAAYGENDVLTSVDVYPVVIKPNSKQDIELSLTADENTKIRVFLWEKDIQTPFTKSVTVTRIKQEGVIFDYDFEDASEVASLLRGGAVVDKGAGISGGGVVFDGESGYMQLENNILTDEITFMAWMKTDKIASWARLFDFGADTSNNFFYSPQGGRVESVINGTTDTMNVEAFANTGVWEHYAVTRTANKVQLYRNGVLVSEAACSAPIASLNESTNYIGKSHWEADKLFCGKMDEIKLYSRVCTAEEIAKIYNTHAEKISEESAYKDYCDLELSAELTASAILPSAGNLGSSIAWSCSENGVINDDLSINAPSAGEADKTVTFTAVITNGSAEYTKTFEVKILAAPSVMGISDYTMQEVLLTDAYLVNGEEKMAEYLKEFDVDRSVEGFRRTAGIGKNIATYGGWETSLIAGHAIGHYVSALAQGYAFSEADTADEELLAQSQAMIDALYEAQIKEDGTVNGASVKKGYLFATTDAWNGGSVVTGEGQFDNVEANRTNITKQAWVPWYTMHKILAGLVDTYKFTGNEKALEMASELGTWVYNRVGGYNTTMQNRVLNIEYGGMNDVLYELYKITGDANHAKAAHMFDEISLFDSIYNKQDVLANKHANTTIPKIIGALNRYRTNVETDGQLLVDSADNHDIKYYLTVAENFWDMVVNDHSYVTGGNSQDEHFRAPHTENAYRDNVNCETCNTYNMLKLSRELYKITGDKKYADYYESTFLNAIVSSQNPETGMTMYFQPMGTGYYKVFSSKWDEFWCCTGSGMESFTKLNDSIYYKSESGIIVNQYISSILTDEANNIKLTQESTLPDGETTKIMAEPIEGSVQNAAIMLRVPEWVADEPVLKINGEETDYVCSAGYITIERDWAAGDYIELTMPMEIRAYGLYDSDTVTAFKYGPTVLSVGLGKDNMVDTAHGMAVRKPRSKADVNEYVIIDSSYGTREDWLANLDENMLKTEGKLEFTMQNTDQALVFTPHYRRYDERYGIYWYVTGMSAEEQQEQILADKQAARENNIIIDSIEPSHDQQENGHGYSQENSTGVEGSADMTNYREIKSGGYVDYQMAVNKSKKNYLSVTYSADDAGKKMNIYAGDTLLSEVVASGNDETVLYEIPQSVVDNAFVSTADTINGRDAVHIVFKAECGTDAPKICEKVMIVTDYSTNASLEALGFEGATLSPEFNSDTTEYTLVVDSGVSGISMTAKPADKYGLVYVNDVLINDASAKTISDLTGSVKIEVFAEDHETSRIYTITIAE